MEKVLEILSNVGFDWKVAIANFVNFLIILFILNQFVFKSMSRTLAARRTKIEEGLAMREQAAQDLKNAFAEKTKIVASARDEESAILAQAHSKATTLREDMLVKAERESVTIIEKAEGELGHMKRDLHTEWTNKAPRLVVALTEKILMQKFTKDVNEEYVKNLIR